MPHVTLLQSELAALGALAIRLAEGASDGVDAGLDALLGVTGAECCELFLQEPEGGDMVLAARRGPDADAFASRDRFSCGTGFPGIIAATARALITQTLPDDRRFLRHTVIKNGFRTYVGVPLPSGGAPWGALAMAWRTTAIPIERHRVLLEHAASLVAAALRAERAAGRAAMRRAVRRIARDDGAARRVALLGVLRDEVEARDATLVVHGASGVPSSVVSVTGHPVLCAMVRDRVRCPLLRRGHGAVVGGATSPTGCPGFPAPPGEEAAFHLCLPLRQRGELRGAVFLACGGAPSHPPGRELVRALEMTTRRAPLLLRGTTDAPAADARTPPIVLRCLGPTEFRIGSRVLRSDAFPRRKALQLLQVLVLAGGAPVSRDYLAETLWPEVSPGAGVNRLHVALHALRSVLEPFCGSRRGRFVRHRAHTYYLDPETPLRVDFHDFQRLAARARSAERHGRTSEAIRALERAVALYGGSLFADDPHAEWCAAEREHLHTTFLDVVRQLTRLCTASGRGERAMEPLRRALVLHPLQEDLHCALIEALGEQGRVGEAIAQYELCARLLRLEFDAEPRPETQAAVRRLGIGARA